MGEERGFGNNEDGVEAGKTHGLGIEEEGKHVGGGGKETWWQQTHTGGGRGDTWVWRDTWRALLSPGGY